MVDETGNIKIYNSDKLISEKIIFESIRIHNNAMLLTRTGIPPSIEEMPKNYNEKIKFRFEGLKNVISIQQHIIVNIGAIVKTNCKNKYNKKYKDKEERDKNSFEEEDNDYNELQAIFKVLEECEEQIEKSIKTKNYNDDFIWEKNTYNGEIRLEITPNFKKMFNLLGDTYQSIYEIMINNNLVSNGSEDDEELTYKEQEELFKERVVNA